MQNLQFFHFNNLAFRYRVFDRADEVTPIVAGHFHRAVDLSLFETDWCEPFAACEKRLFSMIGFSGEVLETGEHFVDAAGVAWLPETLVVIENPYYEWLPRESGMLRGEGVDGDIDYRLDTGQYGHGYQTLYEHNSEHRYFNRNIASTWSGVAIVPKRATYYMWPENINYLVEYETQELSFSVSVTIDRYDGISIRLPEQHIMFRCAIGGYNIEHRPVIEYDAVLNIVPTVTDSQGGMITNCKMQCIVLIPNSSGEIAIPPYERPTTGTLDTIYLNQNLAATATSANTYILESPTPITPTTTFGVYAPWSTQNAILCRASIKHYTTHTRHVLVPVRDDGDMQNVVEIFTAWNNHRYADLKGRNRPLLWFNTSEKIALDATTYTPRTGGQSSMRTDNAAEISATVSDFTW